MIPRSQKATLKPESCGDNIWRHAGLGRSLLLGLLGLARQLKALDGGREGRRAKGVIKKG